MSKYLFSNTSMPCLNLFVARIARSNGIYPSFYAFLLSSSQLAVTIVGLMEQYIVNNYTDVPTKSIVWHERSHGMPLMIAHHRMFDVVRAEFAPAKRINLYKKLLEGNSTGLEERCRAVFERKV